MEIAILYCNENIWPVSSNQGYEFDSSKTVFILKHQIGLNYQMLSIIFWKLMEIYLFMLILKFLILLRCKKVERRI